MALSTAHTAWALSTACERAINADDESSVSLAASSNGNPPLDRSKWGGHLCALEPIGIWQVCPFVVMSAGYSVLRWQDGTGSTTLVEKTRTMMRSITIVISPASASDNSLPKKTAGNLVGSRKRWHGIYHGHTCIQSASIRQHAVVIPRHHLVGRRIHTQRFGHLLLGFRNPHQFDEGRSLTTSFFRLDNQPSREYRYYYSFGCYCCC